MESVTEEAPRRLTLVLSPRGHLLLEDRADAAELEPGLAGRLRAAFARGVGHGLLRLGAGEVRAVLPPELTYWRDFGGRYVTALCGQAGGDEAEPHALLPAANELAELVLAAPPMMGGEYLSSTVLATLWDALGAALAVELRESAQSLAGFLKGLHPAWNLVGRVHFNLAENRRDEAAPFAFLATYTTRLSAQGKAQHLPLGQALREYAGAANRERLSSLLVPVQRAAEACAWLKAMVDAGEIFHPLRWSPEEAMRFLTDAPSIEAAGVVVRMPAGWRANRPPRPQVSVSIGAKPPVGLGKEALLDFRMAVTLDGEVLSAAERRELLSKSDGLALIRGRWVEVDRARLAEALKRYQELEKAAAADGVTFAEAMRLVARAEVGEGSGADAVADWVGVEAGPWLAQTLAGLRSPEGLARLDPGRALKGTLRPYQQVGVRWLHLLAQLGLGACLADDMGLGKTIQVLSLLLVQKRAAKGHLRPSLLVAPASLLANWVAEIERFAPSLKVMVAHPSFLPATELKNLPAGRVAEVDLCLTSYGSLLRLPWLASTDWHLAVIDEAQAIKNPEAKQTRALKQVRARARLALTGTPVENRLGDLWSIFDFINPGLLGTAKEFTNLAKALAARRHDAYAPLRNLVRPYILRRLKTDKTVIADLPDKTELKAFCSLSRKQAALYQDAVDEFAQALRQAEGIKRRGLVLATLMRLRQICNHPSQWLGDNAWHEAESGKWERLREIAEVIAAKQEKMLVFTQFREMTEPLAGFLGAVFGRPGLVLHGETAVKKRQSLVKRFQEDETIPFFVLSLKAGGSGLNLTAASHVVHFDRWWNPAVENQATDRAFRIGQTKNVLVHKFVCRGTVEEKMDQLIESKRKLAHDLLDSGDEVSLTEMRDDELLRLVALDVKSAMREI